MSSPTTSQINALLNKIESGYYTANAPHTAPIKRPCIYTDSGDTWMVYESAVVARRLAWQAACEAQTIELSIEFDCDLNRELSGSTSPRLLSSCASRAV